MWKFYVDGTPLQLQDRELYQIIDPSLTLALNTAGAFTFTIYPTHPAYSSILRLKSIITVYQDGDLIFRGRATNDTAGWNNQRQITCEGELAFLQDSVQRPFHFPVEESDPATPAAYFTFLMARHNAQVDAARQFKLGNVTVADNNDYINRSDTQYSSTWTLLNEGLLKTLGGYLWVRHESDGNYLDYLADFSTMSNQPVVFGKNLLDIKTKRQGDAIITALLPLGEKNDDGNRITVASLPDDTSGDIRKSGDYVYSVSMAAQYGMIFGTETWDKVTEPSNLLTKAKASLSTKMALESSIELSAADLSAAGFSYSSFRLGTYVCVEDEPHAEMHSLQSTYLVKKLSVKPFSPASNKLTVGSTTLSYTDHNRTTQADALLRVEANAEESQSKAIAELEQRTSSAITQSADSVLSKVSDDFYTKGDTDSLVSSVSTELEQTQSQIELRFTQFSQDAASAQAGNDAEFALIQKYIRFVDGNILLGEAGNELTLKIQNDRISFLQGELEVAYFSNQKLYVTDGEFINSLQLGKFAFIPRQNGNLTFKKVVD